MICYEIEPGSEWPQLYAIFDCPVETQYSDIQELKNRIATILSEIGLNGILEFASNEDIGGDYMLYRLHLKPYDSSDHYIGIRVVSYKKEVRRLIATIPRELKNAADTIRSRVEISRYDALRELYAGSRNAGRQRFIPYQVIYAVRGIPSLSPENWVLRVAGLVREELELKYSDLDRMPKIDLESDFHCVTGWSVKGLLFTGVPAEHIIEVSKPLERVRWVFIEGYDGYTSIVPLDEFGKGLIALRLNGRPIPVEHGGPVRVFFPELFGWKSVKWVKQILFTDEYRDGYWEKMGYHPRGRVDRDERFKML
ncbi:molybdopterin-dependent oxidoreductase [Thermogladius sp. 4427co]|uniref:molybdopterin-dependent oxidoreductase n=1 Tax=Thermogladius sp. 4427co TaxID=3450718 RepID=UPI003F790A0F